jgi:phage-related protein
MTPYVIINGVSSKTINGLIVQSLPPITKPRLRTSREEIDGRDGDINTILGYSAYDKPVLIGLKGDYSVDDVIKFFNQSGRVTFSNELDKYYFFAQYDPIDFNRLLRFRTATVNLHVQPFKYSAEEPPFVVEETGTIHQLNIWNQGNIYSRPKLTIDGEETITIYKDGEQILSIDLGETRKKIIIEDFNTTDGQGNYLNRLVSGNYEDLKLATGRNDIRVTGKILKMTFERFSRWI